MTKLAVFRCDAGRSIGTGHLIRCLALAETLVDRGWACRFLSLPGSRAAVARFARLPAEIVEAHAVDDPGAVRALVPEGCDLFVLDSYRLGIQHETALKEWASSTLVLDDRPFRRHAADILLDPTLRRAPSAYEPLVDKDTEPSCSGRAMRSCDLSSPVRAESVGEACSTDTVAKILVASAAGVASDRVDLVLEGCRISGLSGELHVVAPTACHLPFRSGGVIIMFDGLPPSSSPHGCLQSRHRRGRRCAPGAVLPRPAEIMVGIADNESDVAAALAESGAHRPWPRTHHHGRNDCPESCDLTGDVERRREMLSRGPLEFATGWVPPCCGALAPGSPRWQARHPAPGRPGRRGARIAGSRSSRPAPHTKPGTALVETHLGWLERRLADIAAGPFSMIVKDSKDIGVLRLDQFERGAHNRHVEADALRISIYLEPESHGQGVGTAALEAARFLVPRRRFTPRSCPAMRLAPPVQARGYPRSRRPLPPSIAGARVAPRCTDPVRTARMQYEVWSRHIDAANMLTKRCEGSWEGERVASSDSWSAATTGANLARSRWRVTRAVSIPSLITPAISAIDSRSPAQEAIAATTPLRRHPADRLAR